MRTYEGKVEPFQAQFFPQPDEADISDITGQPHAGDNGERWVLP